MKINKENIILWDIETTKLNYIAFQLAINNTKKINEEFAKLNRNVRYSYTTLSCFVKSLSKNKDYQEYIKEAKIILRRDKIKKITKCIKK